MGVQQWTIRWTLLHDTLGWIIMDTNILAVYAHIIIIIIMVDEKIINGNNVILLLDWGLDENWNRNKI